jgi:hypothetical protein
MSVKLMSTVWKTDIQSPAAKLVLLSLADRANDDGKDCFPKIETVAKRCGLTYRGVTKVIKELEAAGHITIKSGRGKHRSNDFFVHPNLSSKWERGSYLRKRENGNQMTPKWEPDDTKMGTDEHENRNVVPTYTSVPIIEPSITTNGTAPIETANASSLFDSPPSSLFNDDDSLSIPIVTSEKKKKNVAQKEKVWEPDEYQKIISEWFGRRERTRWSEKELKAYRKLGAETIKDGIEDLNDYYSDNSRFAKFKRRSILTLLNNWVTDMDTWVDWLEQKKEIQKEEAKSKPFATGLL